MIKKCLGVLLLCMVLLQLFPLTVYAGDKFDVANYQEFFYEGLMDDGSVFGYTVEIVSIGKDADGNPAATIRVTAN